MRRGGLRAAVPRQLQRRHLSVHLLPRRALEAARVPLRIRLQKVLPIVAQERGQVVLLSEQDRRCDPFGVGAVKLLRLLLLRPVVKGRALAERAVIEIALYRVVRTPERLAQALHALHAVRLCRKLLRVKKIASRAPDLVRRAPDGAGGAFFFQYRQPAIRVQLLRIRRAFRQPDAPLRLAACG